MSLTLCGCGWGGFQLSPCPGFSQLQSKSLCLLSICVSFHSAFYFVFLSMCPGELVTPELIKFVVGEWDGRMCEEG